MNRRIPAALAVVVAMVAVAISSSPWRDAFVNLSGGLSVGVTLGIAAVLGVAVPVVVGSLLGRRLVWSLPASVVVYVVGALLLAVQPVMSVASLADGYSSALARLLQSTPPLVVGEGTLVPAFTLVWITGALVGEMLVRTRVTVGMAIPPLLGFGVAYAATAQLDRGSGFGGSAVVWSFALLGVLGLLVVLRRLTLDASTVTSDVAAEREVALRSPLIAVVLLVLAGLLAFAVAPQIPGVSDDPAGLDRTPPVDEPEPDSPVEVMASYRRAEGIVNPPVVDAVLFRVDINQPSTGYLSIANLDSYDGGAWRFDRLFNPTGLEVPGAPPSSQELVRQDYEVVEPLPLAEQWMPALDRPVVVAPFTIEGTGDSRKVEVVYDAATGMILSPAPMGAGTSFTIESLPLTSPLSTIAGDTPVASSTISAPGETATVLRDANNILGGWTTRIGNDLSAPLVGDVTSLVAMRDWMRDNFALTDDNIEAKLRAEGVVNPERVVRSLALLSMTEKLLNGDGQGTPEQLATMYVMLARGLGVPARLATGFRVVSETVRDQELPAGTYEVTGGDAWTWAEVLIGDEGWIVVDPAPPSDQVVPPPTTTTIPEGSKQEEEIPNEDLIAILPSPVAEPPPPVVAQPPWVLIIIGSLVVLALVVFVLAAALRRRLRRRNRRRGDPRQQVVGAWREALDELSEADLAGLTPLAPSEVAAAASERFGPEVGAPVAGVATLSTPAVFSSAPVDPMSAEEAWRNLDTARKALRRSLSPRQRFVATVRSLRPRR